MPVIGAVSELDDFFLAGGRYAFAFAPLWAKTLADLVTQQPQLPVDTRVSNRIGSSPAAQLSLEADMRRSLPRAEPASIWLTSGHIVDVRDGSAARNVAVAVTGGRIGRSSRSPKCRSRPTAAASAGATSCRG